MATSITLRSSSLVAIVDDDDATLVNEFKWYANKRSNGFRAIANCRRPDGKRTMVQMHRLITGAKAGELVDHADGNPLNNQRSNLRVCNQQQNQANRGAQRNNTSGFKGVWWHSSAKKWAASIWVSGKHKLLGLFNDPHSAAFAYDQAAMMHFGDFARTNADAVAT
jgi:hypothetical protein